MAKWKPKGEREPPPAINKSHPCGIRIARNGDHVVLQVGPVVVGIEPATARTLAESIVAIVGDIEGTRYMLVGLSEPERKPKEGG